MSVLTEEEGAWPVDKLVPTEEVGGRRTSGTVVAAYRRGVSRSKV